MIKIAERFELNTRGANLTAIVTGEVVNSETHLSTMQEFGLLGWKSAGPVMTLAQRLCHEDSGLLSDPETAEKVAAWLEQHFVIAPKE
jgi:hypothetical protein